MEVVDEFNNSTVWDDPFDTDTAALAEVKKTILSEGIEALIGLSNHNQLFKQRIHQVPQASQADLAAKKPTTRKPPLLLALEALHAQTRGCF